MMMISNSARKPNYTQTARYFRTTKPIVEQLVPLPPPTLRNPNPMYRLAFGAMTAKEDISFPRLHDMMTRGPLQSTFIFPDTGVITTSVPQQFWDVCVGRQIAFTEMTAAELNGWFGYPMHNGYLHSWLPRAMRECLQKQASVKTPFRSVQVVGDIASQLVPFTVSVAERSRLQKYGFDHYVNFLSLRKRLGRRVFRELQTELGREPTDNEFKQKLARDYHPRISSIAFKGWKDWGKRNYLADEELVVLSVITAVMTGMPALILTRDTDVFENFAKLCHELTADYAAFRFGEVHSANPEGCPMFSRNIGNLGKEIGLVGDAVHQVFISQEDMDGLPPYSHTPVHTFCVLLGNTVIDPKVSIAGFCVETEMEGLLFVKGRTNGRNTERFGKENLRVGTSLTDGVKILLMRAEEKPIDYEGVSTTWIDLQHALKCDPIMIRKRRAL